MDGKNQKGDASAGHSEFKPGDAVSLRPETTTDTAEPAPTTSTDTPPEVLPEDEPLPPPSSQFETDDDEAFAQTNEPEITWTASEFIAHDKSVTWYAGLAGVTVAGLIVAYLISHDWVALTAIAICAGLFGYSASRAPRQLQYAIGTTGINVGAKFYPYADFRAFSIAQDGPFSSIDFAPLKRFAMPLSVYYDPQHDDRIVETLSRHLPIADHKRTAVDGLMHRVRF